MSYELRDIPFRPTLITELSMYNPIDPETHLRNVATETRRTLEANRRRRILDSTALPQRPRRIRFRHT